MNVYNNYHISFPIARIIYSFIYLLFINNIIDFINSINGRNCEKDYEMYFNYVIK